MKGLKERRIYQKREFWCREIKDENRKKREQQKFEKQQKISTSLHEVKIIQKDDVGEKTGQNASFAKQSISCRKKKCGRERKKPRA